MRARGVLWGAVLVIGCGGSTVETSSRADGEAGAGGATKPSAGTGGLTSATAGSPSAGGSSIGGAGMGAGTTGAAGASGLAGGSGLAGASGLPGSGGAADTFPQKLEGTWLIGWSGGLNHYSWFRFRAVDPSAHVGTGNVDVLGAVDSPTNLPLFDCSGVGTWFQTAKIDTVQLMLPAGCNPATFYFSITAFESTNFPENAILHATMDTFDFPKGTPIEGFKLPPEQCDAAFTSCGNPWGF